MKFFPGLRRSVRANLLARYWREGFFTPATRREALDVRREEYGYHAVSMRR